MKATHKFYGFSFQALAISLALLLTFSACDKDDDKDNGKAEIESVFEVPDATLRTGSFPSGSSTGPSIANFSGNAYVLPGGSNAITLESDSEATSALIGIEGLSGYYEVPISSKNQVSVTIYLFVDPNINLESFTILLALQLNTTVGNHQSLNVDLVEAGTGQLQVSLSWDKEVDLDIYLVEPGGTTIYYGNPFSDFGGELDIDSNAACYIDGINNENITYDDEAVLEAGEYIVRVNLWSNCDIIEQINYVATARFNGSLISPSWGSNPKYGNYPAGSESQFGGMEAGIEVMKFNISSSKLENAKTFAKFSFPAADMKSYPATK